MEIKAADWNSLRKIVWNIGGTTNLHTLSFDLASFYDFSRIYRSFNKLDTQNLHVVSFCEVNMNLQHLVRIIHKCDALWSLEYYSCKINFHPRSAKINKTVRLKLQNISFNFTDINFELEYLAEILMQNESLRKQLRISRSHFKQKRYVLKLSDVKF